MPKVDRFHSLLLTMFGLLLDAFRFFRISVQPRCTLAAENLFLRKQLALYLERRVEPRRPKTAAKLSLVLLSRVFPWRQALTIVKPETFIRWHRQGFRLFWKWKSRPRGRPRIPAELQKLILEMASDNPAWGEERIAAELLLKVGTKCLLGRERRTRGFAKMAGPGEFRSVPEEPVLARSSKRTSEYACSLWAFSLYECRMG